MNQDQIDAFNSVGIFTCEQWLKMINWLSRYPQTIERYTPQHLQVCLAREAGASPINITPDVVETAKHASVSKKLKFLGAFK